MHLDLKITSTTIEGEGVEPMADFTIYDGFVKGNKVKFCKFYLSRTYDHH
jgi:hypothetical protein